MLSILSNLKLNNKKVLIVVDELNENLILATRNIASVMLLEASEINTLLSFLVDFFITNSFIILLL